LFELREIRNECGHLAAQQQGYKADPYDKEQYGQERGYSPGKFPFLQPGNYRQQHNGYQGSKGHGNNDTATGVGYINNKDNGEEGERESRVKGEFKLIHSDSTFVKDIKSIWIMFPIGNV
jgi:hypothetical protein